MYTPTKHFSKPIFQPAIHPEYKRGFITKEALRLLRTKHKHYLNITNFKTHLLERGYPENFIQTTLSEVTFKRRSQAL